jgi:ATP-dependent DNA helicase DinG
VTPPQLVFIDTETTGLDPARDRIIDLAAVRVDARLRVTDRFSTLVNPGVPLPLLVERLTGITAPQLTQAPSFAETYAGFLEFLGDALIVGQNIAFDLEFLAAEARRRGLPAPAGSSFDTLDASLLLYPELDRHGLGSMAEHLHLEHPTHRALPDALATAGLFASCCRRAAALAEPERRLLVAAGWRPLQLLDAFKQPPDEAPPPFVAAEPSGPAAAEPAALPVDEAGWRSQFFSSEGLAASLPGFRSRPGQTELAEAVACVFEKGGVGLFEAGTGMGKSLAYLLPAAFAGAARGERVLVSTKTKALQRQLASHDLPLVEAALPPGWHWALLMGRENYLCRRFLDETVAEAAHALPDPQRALALAYLLGRARRGEVDLSALPYRATLVLPELAGLARELRSSSATCLRRRCPARTRCHWRLARARAEAAHLVCVNHALLLAGGGLPAYEQVVIDEAHLLPGEATAAFSTRVDWATVDGFVWTLRGRRRQRSLAARLRAAAARLERQQMAACEAAAESLERAAAELPGRATTVAYTLAALAGADTGDEGLRGGYARSVWLRSAQRELPAWDPFAAACALLAEELQALAAAAQLAVDSLPEEQREAPQLQVLAQEAGEAAALLAGLPDLADPQLVCWGELDGPDRWSLTRAPLSAAGHVRDLLWDKLRSAVLTSATLSVGGSFAYFREQAGLDRDLDVTQKVFASPFDFSRQAVLVLEHDPATAFSADDLPTRQADRLRQLIDVTGGRLLALFTNRRHMEQVAGAIGEHLESDGVVLLAQGVHGSAAALADEFRAHPATVLLGVDTLWTGQDFPGDVLVCLVIAKLPFGRQDAFFRARRQAMEDEGADWFRRFYLPEAVLRFRQGFGRLIRTETDRGVVVVLDHRLTQKAYEKDFLGSLPRLPVERVAPQELSAVVAAHLRRLLADQPTEPSRQG